MFNEKIISIIGTNGQLGSKIKELSSSYEGNYFFTCKDGLDYCLRRLGERR